ncbi:Acyl carrier protein phosphodiesterase [Hymenobacter daecheongensis DSM 21074]|uniref:Acyl carrier protein phosphodiesterase n=1 Tax=Hymenobacter daecheongensis DSM 21074 TaxID=1121955 RepID=A0A1M6JYV9_9BACT|nr:ACP phosphodiesterase [Hymenobacter daecheongensis]SHJ51864.1 Acyl carrier protein phosphodiesterase [Hymenobacter daecheongensis DSM 21074]
MNFLAHLLLSGSPAATPDYDDIVVGNFAAEAVRGRAALEAYPATVQRGIRLHRFIDSFTDSHPVVRRSTARLRAAGLGKWAGVVADVGYDHLLARDFAEFHPAEPLPAFAQRMYALLHARRQELPERLQHMFQYMRRDDWLTGYARPEGLNRALLGLSRRVPNGAILAAGAAAFLIEVEAYEADFREFWPELRAGVVSMLLQ